MHDEKKIEEMVENIFNMTIVEFEKEIGSVLASTYIDLLKQYAEHMVQQERERILGEIKNINIQGAPKGIVALLKEGIIKHLKRKYER